MVKRAENTGNTDQFPPEKGRQRADGRDDMRNQVVVERHGLGLTRHRRSTHICITYCKTMSSAYLRHFQKRANVVGMGRNRTDDTRIFSLKIALSRNTHFIGNALHFNMLPLINSFPLRHLLAPSVSRSAAELPRKTRSGSGTCEDSLGVTTDS